jgi:hypothetical protein
LGNGDVELLKNELLCECDDELDDAALFEIE